MRMKFTFKTYEVNWKDGTTTKLVNGRIVTIKTEKNTNLKSEQMLERYKQNLRVDRDQVWSYTTHVATIAGDKLIQLGYWSMTTQKHINYVAKQFDLELIKP
jgi:hypothetical protein